MVRIAGYAFEKGNERGIISVDGRDDGEVVLVFVEVGFGDCERGVEGVD